MKQNVRRERNLADYGYPSPDIAALSAKALEVTRRLTELYGVAAWSSKDPMSQLVDIILSHRTRDEQTAAAYDNLLKRFGSWEGVRDAPTDRRGTGYNCERELAGGQGSTAASADAAYY